MKFLILHVTAAGMSASWQDAAWHAAGALYIEYMLVTLEVSRANGRLKSVVRRLSLNDRARYRPTRVASWARQACL